jgi:16S rRNA G966 N2-methylase RsmD
LKISELQPDNLNANRGTKRGRKAVETSLSRYGAGRSILIDRAGRIIAGNKTIASAAAAGIEEVILVPSDGKSIIAVQRTDLDLDSPEGRALAIADNRAAELGLEWDPEVLGQLATDLDLKPFFTTDELAEIVPSTVTELLGDEDDAPEPPVDPVTKPGDLYILGDHRLLCGDATSPTDISILLDGVLPDMVFTDPPYGIKVQMNNPGTVCKGTIMGDDTTDVAAAAYNLCAAMNVPLLFWGANHYVADAKLPNASCWVVWDKQGGKHVDHADCELAWTNLKGPARVFKHIWDGFRRDSEKGERRVHPTQKPVALLIEILGFFKAGRDILDLFGGSGSTLIACEKTKRSALLMEIDPKYCDVIVSRWEKATGKKAVLYGRTPTNTDLAQIA